MTNKTDIPSSVYDELIAWSVRLHSGQASVVEQQQFLAWRNRHPTHEAAWQALHAMEQPFTGLPATSRSLVAHTLTGTHRPLAVNRKRRRTLKVIGSTAMVLATIMIASQQVLGWNETLHYSTGIGQTARYQLSDGTQLMLNTGSQVDIRYTLLKRELILTTGEIYIETGKDSAAWFGKRRFWVKSAQASLEAIGTRFSVYSHAQQTELHVADGVVAMVTGQHAPVLAYTNETYHMQGASAIPLKITQPQSDPISWLDGVLVAKQMPLDHLLSELSRYQALSLTVDADVTHLKVSGVFQLKRPDVVEHAVSTMYSSLPIRYTRQGDTLHIQSH